MAKTETVVDGFDVAYADTTAVIAGGRWTGSFGVVSQLGSNARVAVDSSTTASAALKSGSIFTIKDSFVMTRIATLPAANGATGPLVQAQLVVSNLDGTNFLMISYEAANNVLFMRVAYTDASAPLAFSLTNHRWLAMAEGAGATRFGVTGAAAGTTYWFTSADGFTWVQRATATTPAWVTTTSDSSIALAGSRDSGAANFVEWSNINAFPAAAPNAPTGAVATAGSAQASVAWAAPAVVGSSAITDYEVTASPAPATGLPNLLVGSAATSYVFAGLTNGTSYTFTVKAKNTTGLSVASAASPAVTPNSAATAPDIPTALTAVPQSGQVALTWTAPASNGGSVIIDYQVTVSPAPLSGLTSRLLGSAATSYVFTGLNNGTPYTFVVNAKNAIGLGLTSAASASVTPTTGSTVYTLIEQLVDTFSTDGSPSTSWLELDPSHLAVVSAGQLGVPVVSQVLTGLQSANFYQLAASRFVVQVFPATALSDLTLISLDSQTVGTSYRITFQGGQIIGSSLVNNLDVVAPVGKAWDLTKSCYVRFIDLGNGTVSLDYSADGITFQQLRTLPLPDWSVACKVTLGAFNNGGTTPLPTSAAPTVPTSVQALSGDGTATLSWLPPASIGSSPISAYRISRDGNDSTQTSNAGYTTDLPATSASFAFALLNNGTQYILSVAAVNAAGAGPLVTRTVQPAAAVAPPTPAATGFTIGTNAPTAGANTTIDFRTSTFSLDKWSVGTCISGYGSTPVQNDMQWRNLLAALGPLVYRCPVSYNGGNPVSSADSGDHNTSYVAILKTLISIKGIPFVVVGQDNPTAAIQNDNDFTGPAAGGIAQVFLNNGISVERWHLGNEPYCGNGRWATDVTTFSNRWVAGRDAIRAKIATAKFFGPGGGCKGNLSYKTTFRSIANPDGISWHAYDGTSTNWASQQYADEITTDRGAMPGLMYGCEEFNSDPGGNNTGAYDWRNTCFIANVIGKLLGNGAHAYQYSDSNGAKGIISDGSDGVAKYSRLPSYWGVGMWTGMNGQFRDAPRLSNGHMVSSTTSVAGCTAYACDNGKVVLVNNDGAASHSVTMNFGGVTTGTYDLWQTDKNAPFAPPIKKVAAAAYSGATLTLTLPSGTVTSLEMSA